MTTFIFVRHGTTEALDRYLAGRAPGIGLTQPGRDECARAAPKLRLDLLLKTKVPKLERHETTRTVDDLGWTSRLIRQVGKGVLAPKDRQFQRVPRVALVAVEVDPAGQPPRLRRQVGVRVDPVRVVAERIGGKVAER